MDNTTTKQPGYHNRTVLVDLDDNIVQRSACKVHKLFVPKQASNLGNKAPKPLNASIRRVPYRAFCVSRWALQRSCSISNGSNASMTVTLYKELRLSVR